jgi:hypothetical protein
MHLCGLFLITILKMLVDALFAHGVNQIFWQGMTFIERLS